MINWKNKIKDINFNNKNIKKKNKNYYKNYRIIFKITINKIFKIVNKEVNSVVFKDSFQQRSKKIIFNRK